MSSATRDPILAFIVISFLFLYGLWLIWKAIKQIRYPTSIYDLGFGWWMNMFWTFSGGTNEKLSEHFNTPEVIRFYAGLTLLAGFLIAFGPLIIFFIVLLS